MQSALPNSLPCLEIRINSVEDARAEVARAAQTFKRVNAFGLAGVELVIAKEVDAAVRPILAGVFRVKTYTSVIVPRGKNRYFPRGEAPPPEPKVADARKPEPIKAAPIAFAEKAATVSVTGIKNVEPPEAKPIPIADGMGIVQRQKPPIRTEKLPDSAAQTLFASGVPA